MMFFVFKKVPVHVEYSINFLTAPKLPTLHAIKNPVSPSLSSSFKSMPNSTECSTKWSIAFVLVMQRRHVFRKDDNPLMLFIFSWIDGFCKKISRGGGISTRVAWNFFWPTEPFISSYFKWNRSESVAYCIAYIEELPNSNLQIGYIYDTSLSLNV